MAISFRQGFTVEFSSPTPWVDPKTADLLYQKFIDKMEEICVEISRESSNYLDYRLNSRFGQSSRNP